MDPADVAPLDAVIDQIRKTGRTGELAYSDEHKLPRLASEYFAQSCYVGVSQPGQGRTRPRATRSASITSCGGATTRTTKAPRRTRGSTCASCSTTPTRPSCSSCSPATRRASTGSTSTKLAPLAAEAGPTVAEIATPLDQLPDNPNEALLKASR